MESISYSQWYIHFWRPNVAFITGSVLRETFSRRRR